MLALSDTALDDVREGNWKKLSGSKLADAFETDPERYDENPWIDHVVAYCVDEGLTLPSREDDAEVLNEAILSAANAARTRSWSSKAR